MSNRLIVAAYNIELHSLFSDVNHDVVTILAVEWVLGQNGSGQNGSGQNGMDKMVYGQNGTDKMVRTKW